MLPLTQRGMDTSSMSAICGNQERMVSPAFGHEPRHDPNRDWIPQEASPVEHRVGPLTRVPLSVDMLSAPVWR